MAIESPLNEAQQRRILGNAGHADQLLSHQYIFAFPIRELPDIPPEFSGLCEPEELRAGVFLPRDDADWRGRRDYPARVLLLTDQQVVVADHPAEQQPVLRIPVSRIHTVECGRILLPGWLELTWEGGRKCLPYNTRTRGPVEAYVKALLERWLPPLLLRESPAFESFGKGLNSKFSYARASALIPGETAVAQFFQPPVCHVRRWFLLRRQDWSAADLLIVTSRRLLWITDRHQGRYERYGIVCRSAPLPLVAEAGCAEIPSGAEFKIVLDCGATWRIPLGESETREARKFEDVFRRTLNALTGQTR